MIPETDDGKDNHKGMGKESDLIELAPRDIQPFLAIESSRCYIHYNGIATHNLGTRDSTLVQFFLFQIY